MMASDENNNGGAGWTARNLTAPLSAMAAAAQFVETARLADAAERIAAALEKMAGVRDANG